MIGILLLAFTACKKSPESIGDNLISGDDYIAIYHTATTQILCHSYLDSVATRNASYALLGAMRDPVFGATEAGFYTQFRDGPVIDRLLYLRQHGIPAAVNAS